MIGLCVEGCLIGVTKMCEGYNGGQLEMQPKSLQVTHGTLQEI